MYRRTWAVVSIAAAALAGLVLTALADDDEEIVVPKAIREAVNKMADDVSKDKDINKDAATFFKAHPDDLKKTMWIYKPRMAGGAGGIGVGPKPGPFKVGDTELPDGIEGVIITLGNPRHRALRADDLKMAAPDLKRMADVILAMAAITQQYKPAKKVVDKNAKDWAKFTDELEAAAKELKAAVDRNKPDETKTAFVKVYSSCTRCHAIFRDDENIIVPQKTKDAVNKMADEIAKGKKVDQLADAFAVNNNDGLKKIMWIFKPRDGAIGGLGVGKPGLYKPDGIEAFILNQNKPQPKTTLNVKAASDDLNRLADITLAMSEITARYEPQCEVGGRNPKQWKLANDDVKQAALALKAAVKEENEAGLKKAFGSLAVSCTRCHAVFLGAAGSNLVIPPTMRASLNAMADAVGKGEKIDKATDAFFKDHQGEFKTIKRVFAPRAEDGTGGFGIGRKPGVYQPDQIDRYVLRNGSPQTEPFTAESLRAAANDLDRLADVLIVMAEVTERYKPKAIVIGGPKIATPAEWTKSANAMRQAAMDLKAGVQANKPDDVQRAFRDLNTTCLTCHLLFR